MGNYIDADGRDRSFLLDKHRFTTIDVPGALGSYAIKINDRGQIVGIYSTLSNFTIDPLHGYLLDNGVFTTIDFPGAVSTRLNDIDNRGQIVGEYPDAAGAIPWLPAATAAAPSPPLTSPAPREPRSPASTIVAR